MRVWVRKNNGWKVGFIGEGLLMNGTGGGV